MQYQEAMLFLSSCGLGAAVLSAQNEILELNDTGDRLLHGEGMLIGRRLAEIAPALCQASPVPLYANIAFGEYLTRCPAPQLSDLPAGGRLLVFRDATNDACHDMLINVLNQVSQSIVLCDGEGRMYLLNDAAVKLDSMVTRDVLGESVRDVYKMLDGTEMSIPRVIQEKKPILNHRQYYATRYGREVDAVSNTFPITQNGQVLGAFNILEDWSTIDSLHKQIIDLQEKLVKQTSASQAGSKSTLSAKYSFRDIIHTSASMDQVVKRCQQVARSDSSVMLYGETGTGKELFAQSIHNASSRADGPFLAINCAALPENLLESLLFGTEKGAYTGAERRAGLFEQANHGTLLLDEINSMNINLQSKLLRVLQDGVVRRVGGSTEIQVDVRVLSNINIPPYQAIAENRLRRDLFFRLGVVNINIPPLRERKEDIALLAKHFIMVYNKKLVKNVRGVDKAALERFRAYDWPGNVRELQHAVEHAMNILPDDQSVISLAHIPEHIALGWNTILPDVPRLSPAENGPMRQAPQNGVPLGSKLQKLEYDTLCAALRHSGGNISQAARALNISRQNLQYRIKRYKIDLGALDKG